MKLLYSQSTNGAVNLKNRRMERLDLHRPLKLLVAQGTAYVTVEGDPKDYMMKSGEKLCIKKPGLVLIQGWPAAELRFSA